MASNVSFSSTDSDVFFVEQLSGEPSPQRNKTLNLLNSTELPRAHTKEIPTKSSVATPEPNIATNESDSFKPTILYGFLNQKPIVPPRLNNLNLPPNPLNIVATTAVIRANPTQYDEDYSLQSPKPSDTSPISTPPMNLLTIEGWETPHTSED